MATLDCSPDKERTFFWDVSLAGFGVVAFSNGKKTYVAQYRDDGRSRRKTIGDVESHGIYRGARQSKGFNRQGQQESADASALST